MTEYIDQLAKDLGRYCRVQTVYIPLFGVKLLGDPIPIGKITLRRMDEISTNLLIERLSHVINKTKDDNALKEQMITHEIEQINKYIRNRTCALYEVGAEPERALELAEKETLRVVDLLRYANAALYSADKRVAIGFQGEHSRQFRYVPIISATDDNFSIRGQVVGPLYPLELSPQNIDHMKRIEIFALGNILEKEEPNEFEKTLLLSIEWFSRAQTQLESKNKLLNLITAMETFLTPRGNDPIQKSISEGVAILLEDNPIKRKKLKEKLTAFYRHRSSLTHGRGKEILDSDLRELTLIAGSLIMVLIKMKAQYQFESKDDLLNWVEFRKLGGLSEDWSEYKEILIAAKLKNKKGKTRRKTTKSASKRTEA